MLNSKRSSLIAGGMIVAALVLVPGVAHADHPGIIGPVNHLGFDIIARVIFAALLDGVNPSALGVLLLLCRRAAVNRNDRHTRRSVMAYILGILLVYLLAGILLRSVYVTFGPSLPVQLFQIAIAGLLFMSGLQELMAASNPKHQRLIEIPASAQTFIDKFSTWIDKGLALPLGMFVGVLELFATGAIYLSFVQAITYDPTAPWWVLVVMMAIYLTAFLVPLGLAYSYRGLLARDVKDKNRKHARIARGIIGGVFMAAALFIAASAIVTIQAIGG